MTHEHTPNPPRASLRCKWVRRLLPLLAGDEPELGVADRRKVERHLIVCPDCRERRDALDATLGVLHAAAAQYVPTAPDAAETPSLWPALERQIREARHTPRFPLLARLDGLLESLREAFPYGLGSPRVVASALTLAALAAGVAGWSFWSLDRARQAERLAQRRLERPATRSALDPPPPTYVPPADLLPGTGTTTASRLDYDLDRGTPMGPDARDPASKPSY
ncbi:MAG: zf-HC2 domain-containing protein [Isosphaeraceae bacterium]